jgi:hypothetical protein
MATTAETRIPEPEPPARRGLRELVIVARRAFGAMRLVGATATTFVTHLHATARATQRRARATTGALQVLPDSTLRGLAASSIALGGGTYLARGPRLLPAAAVAPAFVIGAAIILRPNDQVPTAADR